MTRTLEILEEALEEAEEAARWYAERSETAAVAFAEDEAVFRARGQTVMVVPRRLVPAITRLITRQKSEMLRKRRKKTLQLPSRGARKSKP